MTREEAEQALDWFRNRSKTVTMPGAKRMYLLAIEALKAQDAKPMPSGDTISRQMAIDLADKIIERDTSGNNDVVKAMSAWKGCIKLLPSAQPEPHYDEWCTDCKEYDHERHCCPRFNRVIRETLDEVQAERKTGKWVRDPKSNRWRCSECCSFALRTDYREECLSDYCSVCGADMRGEQNEQI